MTDARDIIARQVTYAGETLLLAMEPLDEGEFYAVNANGFSAAWVTGHLACVADLFSSWFDGLPLLLSRQTHQAFNETDVPLGVVARALVDPAYYPKDSLLLLFRQAMVKALRRLREFNVAEWDGPPPYGVPVTLLTAGSVWEHLGRHTDWHLGELAGSMPRFYGTYALNTLPHHLYVPPASPAAWLPHRSESPD